MKIAVVGTRGFPDVQGGVETHCENLYTNLAEAGCDITVFTRKAYVNHLLRTYKGVSLFPLDCPKNKFLEALFHTFKGVLKAREQNADILHIHAIGPSLFTPLALLLGMKVVVTNHGPDYKRGKWMFPAKMFLMFCEWVGMTFANDVIAIASNIGEDIKQRFNREVAIIPNGVVVPLTAVTDDFLRKYELQKKRYILAVGRFVPEKGFDYLIEAFIRGEYKDLKLVIVGDADHEDKFSEKLRADARKNNNIVLTGFLKGRSLCELYSHAGIFVLPSYHEGMPIVLLEAMSYGLSCIASDIPANFIGLDKERYFEAGNVIELKNKIDKFINMTWDEDDKNKMIHMISEKYSWNKIAVETLRIYRRYD